MLGWVGLGLCLLAPAPRAEELTLRSTVFENTRLLRVLLPPGYDDPANAARRYPVFYFFDGIAAFDAWGVPAVAERLWAKRQIPELIFVGIDNGGSTRESRKPVTDRASEYLPYADQSWTTPDAPLPRGDRLPAFFFDEVVPLVDGRFRTRTGAGETGLAGDSFAGVAALYTALARPGRLGFLLVESPSLHVGNGRLLAEARQAAAWPAAVYLGVGTEEGADRETREEMLANVRALQAALRGRPGVRAHLQITAGGEHGYDAWRGRLPGALRWLLAAPAK
jgi:enterochelin esterase-like enzyme